MVRDSIEGSIRGGMAKAIEDIIIGIIIPIFFTVFKLLTNSIPPSQQPPNGLDFFYSVLGIMLILPYIVVFVAILLIKNPLKITFYGVYIFVFVWLNYAIGDYISSLAMIITVILSLIIRIKFISNNNSRDYYPY